MGIQIRSWKRPSHLKASSTQQPKFHREWNSFKRDQVQPAQKQPKKVLLHFLLALHRVQNFIERVLGTTQHQPKNRSFQEAQNVQNKSKCLRLCEDSQQQQKNPSKIGDYIQTQGMCSLQVKTLNPFSRAEVKNLHQSMILYQVCVHCINMS